MVKSKVIVIGGGLSGLISSYELLKRGYDVEIIESSDSVGGLAKSIPWNGDYIDLGPHIYHTPDKDIEKYWKKNLKIFFLKENIGLKITKMTIFMITQFQDNLSIH